MPPKVKGGQKVDKKAQAKKIEDKTFGMKNKKGKKNQQIIQQQQKQSGIDEHKQRAIEKQKGEERQRKKDEERMEKKRKMEAALAAKKKDEQAARLQARRDAENEAEARRLMEKKIEYMEGPMFLVESADGASDVQGEKARKKQAIIDAMLAEEEAKRQAKIKALTMEQLVERERKALATRGPLTPVNADSFAVWKDKKKAELKAKREKEEAKKAKDAKSGKRAGLTGRDLFELSPQLFELDDHGNDDDTSVDDLIASRDKGERVTNHSDTIVALGVEEQVADVKI